MEAKSYTSYFAVIGLMALTSIGLAVAVDVRVSDQAGVRSALPDEVGLWRGTALWFCQEATCQREIREGELAGATACPSCGGKIGTMSFIEARLLPSDTVLLKKRYTNQVGQVIYASIVVSGRERASIHRPEVCLAGQGTEIANQQTIEVPMPGRDALEVKVLDLLHRKVGPGASPAVAASYYAYWFVGHGRETPEHWKRMWWMATDRVLHNIAHRWAYISVAASRPDDSGSHLDQARIFIRDLYPQMWLAEP